MKNSMTFKYETHITVDKDEVIEYLKDKGFFDIDVEDEDGYSETVIDEEAIRNYEPTYEDFEAVASEKWYNDDCDYYGPDPI